MKPPAAGALFTTGWLALAPNTGVLLALPVCPKAVTQTKQQITERENGDLFSKSIHIEKTLAGRDLL